MDHRYEGQLTTYPLKEWEDHPNHSYQNQRPKKDVCVLVASSSQESALQFANRDIENNFYKYTLPETNIAPENRHSQ